MNFPSKRVILIYGNSVLLEGIAETLYARDDLTVKIIKSPVDACDLIALQPDLLLVDGSQITAIQAEEFISVFPANHSPPMIRLNLDSQQLTIVSARQFPAASFDDLAQVLESIAAKPK